MACFTCGENFNMTQKDILKMYQDAYLKDKTKNYWFVKENAEKSELLILNDTDFETFRKDNEKKFKDEKFEFAHISEYKHA